MGDVSAEPSMEDILSSIKRIIAEEDAPPRPRRSAALERSGKVDETERDDGILELSEPMTDRHPDASGHTSDDASQPAPATTGTSDAIVSAQTATVTRSALDALSKLMVKPEPPSDGTLEGMVREMLRPMLREWMDANLPDMVEAMVQREIAKITGAH